MAGRVRGVPQIMQMEALECGAACLAMVLAYYGRWVPLEQLRVDCGVSRDGLKAASIMRAAKLYGLSAKGMACSIKALRNKLSYPCILFWNFNHFVVLTGFSRKYAYLNDPGRGQVKVSMAELDDAFTGIAITFEKTDDFEEGGTKPDSIAFIRKRLKGLEGPLALVMVTAALSSLVAILFTSLGQVFLDHVLDDGDLEWLMPLLAVMLGLVIVTCIISIINAVCLARIQGKTAIVSSSQFMRHLLHLPAKFYSQRMVGDLQQRQASNESIAYVLVGQLAPVLVNAVILVLYLVIMLSKSVLLTLVGVSTVVANALVARRVSRQRMNVARSMAMDSGKLYATTIGGIELIETIKSSGAENGYFGWWAGFQALVNEGQVRIATTTAYLGVVPTMLTRLANVAVLVLGIWLIVQQQFTSGALLAFQGFLSSFMMPVNQMIGLGQTVQEMQAQMERVEDVLCYEPDVPEEPVDPEDALRIDGEKLRGVVDLVGVTFGYSPTAPPLVEGFDLHIEPGQWVALVGGSGCGKSTIARLVSGLYEPWSGEVRFDGVPIGEVPRPLLRGSLAVFDQDIVMFDGTVMDNVKLWDESIESHDVITACYDAAVHDAVMEREEGYSCVITPGGSNFSGGQLQRLEIARVLAQNPTIAILDEATSALDAQTEAEVMGRIRDRGITCIVVAHRLSTIRDCDEIIVLDEGHVVERGTHAELLRANGAYAKLVRSE